MTTGIHHVTAITRKVQANVDFYAGFLGLHLVKRTAGYEDAEQLHLFYGDATGSPGSIITFLVWEDGAAGRTGHGQVSEIAFAVPQDSIGEWLTRAMTAHVPIEGPGHEFGAPVLRLKDPDGLIVKLVGVDTSAGDLIAPSRIHSVTLLSEKPAETAAFLRHFGYSPAAEEAGLTRLRSDRDVIDIRNGRGFVPSIPGTGIFDHVALRAPDAEAVENMRLALRDAGPTNVHDRKYFLSLYVREPAGILLEYATDGPGFAVDEPVEELGNHLFLPPHLGDVGNALKVRLPQFALPGEERIPMRDLPFIHRFYTPDDPDGSTIVLLHGTGGNETDLMPLVHAMAPRASLLGVRGRSNEEGVGRWFRRMGMAKFDQEDIRSEARAFDAFMEGAIRAYGLDASRITALGYSNGANFAAAVMGLYPKAIRRSVLLRAMPALEELPEVDLSGAEVLMLTGQSDPYGATAPTLAAWLTKSGAAVDQHVLPTGHGLTADDQLIASKWLAEHA